MEKMKRLRIDDSEQLTEESVPDQHQADRPCNKRQKKKSPACLLSPDEDTKDDDVQCTEKTITTTKFAVMCSAPKRRADPDTYFSLEKMKRLHIDDSEQLTEESVPDRPCNKRQRKKSHSCLDEGDTEEDDKLILALAASMRNLTTTAGPTSNDTDELKIDETETSGSKKATYPELIKEPREVDKKLLCRIGVRLPDGRRVQRSFLRTDPIQMIWSFCRSFLDEAEFPSFNLTLVIPGASKTLDYEEKLTFEESGLSNSMLSVTWDRNLGKVL
ncbi:hypothetical protein MKX03_035405 [Papaver bracteatum]|nr:hypothetical protein MKX03_035405 [Papaver bracteatum]